MGTRTTIEVPADEWLGVGPLVTFAAPDEFAVLGMLRMVGDGARRYWWSGDGRRVVRQRGVGFYLIAVQHFRDRHTSIDDVKQFHRIRILEPASGRV